MKKTLLRRGAVIAACAAAFVLVSCGETEFDGRIDTVYSLDTPEVTAKAYPGVNFVSWKPVAGASSYRVSVYEEGTFKRFLGTFSTECFTDDMTLTNGKTYTYIVEAVSKSNPGTASREVYAKNSRGEASAKAIVPPAGIKALELPAYEGGYDGKTTKEVKNDEWVLDSSKLTVTNEDGKIFVSFPMKAYLKYTVKCYDNEVLYQIKDYTPNIEDGTLAGSDSNANNVRGQVMIDGFAPGKYTLTVMATSENPIYAASDEYPCNEPFEIGDLGVSAPSISVNYLNDNTVRISFSAVKKDGTYVDPACYKLYRRVKGEYTKSDVSGITKSFGNNGSVNYYVDDTITDDKVYEYLLIVTVGKKSEASNWINVNGGATFVDTATTNNKPSAIYLYDVNHFATDADNTVRISFPPAKKDGETVPTSWYKVYRAEGKYSITNSDNTESLAQIEITGNDNKVMLDDADPNTYVVYDTTKPIDPAKDYTYTIVVEDDNGTLMIKKAVLNKETKEKLIITWDTNTPTKLSTWNDYKWTFSANTSKSNDKAISGIKGIKAYLLVTSKTQVDPKVNEVIAKGTPIDVTRDADNTSASDSKYYFTFAKSALSTTDAKVSVVVTAECDGYEDVISEVNTITIIKE